MANSTFLTFVTPELSTSIHGVLQLGFALVFLAVLAITPTLVARFARSEQWQRRLDNIDHSHDPVAAHGSAQELSGAVATPAERWADVLPSLLLVFGLLGTFIGLGLALTEAAGVLSAGPQGGGNQLDNLTSIMGSLGSKFKTSTWGILAFLSLKVWFMLHPYDEQRLAWAAQQVKTRAMQAALQAQQLEADERQRLLDAIAHANDAVHAEQLRTAEAASHRHDTMLALLRDLAAQQIEAQAQANAAQLEEQQRAATAALDRHEASLALLRECASQQIAAQAQGSARLAEALAAASSELVAEHQRALQQVDSHHAETAAALAHMTAQQAGAAARLAECADQQIQRLDELTEHTASTRIAIDAFVNSVQDNVGTMARAAGNMADAAEASGKASVGLGTVIDDFRTTMTGVLGDIRTGLAASIDTMQVNFSNNMSAMSQSLADATSGIQNAIFELSSGVNATIDTLKHASTESVKLQAKAQATFAASGEELMASLGNMQSYVEEMRIKMEAGMTSVATVGQKIMHATSKMSELQGAFEASNEHTKNLVGNVDDLSDDIRHLVSSVVEQRHGREATHAQLVRLSADVAKLLDTQQQVFQQGGNKQLVETLERAAEAWARPSRVADESIERLVNALTQPVRVADETPA